MTHGTNLCTSKHTLKMLSGREFGTFCGIRCLIWQKLIEEEYKMSTEELQLKLMDEDRNELEALTRRASTPQSMALRARIILMLAENSPIREIRKSLHVTRTTIAKWKVRFEENGLDGLNDSPRPGQPSKYGDNTRKVIRNTAIMPPKGKKRWTIRSLADSLKINRGIVQRVLQTCNIKLI